MCLMCILRYAVELLSYNDQDRYKGPYFLSLRGIPANQSEVGDPTPVRIVAGRGNALCRKLGEAGQLLTNCPMVTVDDYLVHSLPSLTWRNAMVLTYERSIREVYKLDNTEFCNSLLRNYSCAYYFPTCDEGGFKLPPCLDMCEALSKECFRSIDTQNVGYQDTTCLGTAATFCTGFPVPSKSDNSGVVLSIILASVLVGAVIIGAIVGYFRKRKFNEEMAR
jgi:hypothetical protein